MYDFDKEINEIEEKISKIDERQKALAEDRKNLVNKLTSRKNEKAAHEMKRLDVVLNENNLKLSDVINLIKQGKFNDLENKVATAE